VDGPLCTKCTEELQKEQIEAELSLTMPPGTILKDKYCIKEVIKVGERGAIYKAIEKKSKQIYAIKEKWAFISTSLQEKEHIINQSMNEYRLLQKLSYPKIPGVKDYFTIDDHYYMVMEFIEGKDLQRLIKEKGEGGLPVKQVVEWGIQVCEALEYLHNHEIPIIYRDLKPSNIMLRDLDQSIFLIDFGIACPYKSDTKSLSRTRIGTVGYMPPEQFHGKYFPASDTFSLGATMYYLTTGRLHVLFGYLPMNSINPDISEELDEIICRSLNIMPSKRFRTATAMKLELNNFLKKDRYTTHIITEVDLWMGELESAENRKTRLKVINNLGRFNDPRAMQTLRDILKNDTDAHCRYGAAFSLSRIIDSDTMKLLIEQAEKDRNIKVRCACIESLSNFKNSEVMDFLLECLKDKNGAIRKSSAIALENQGDIRALQPLKEVREKEGIFTILTRKAMDKAIETLKNLEEKALKPMSDKLEFPSVEKAVRKTDIIPEEFDYKETDKIYLKLIYVLFDNEAEMGISLILNNKPKLDNRFFEILDYEFKTFIANNSKREESLTYLIKVLDNLRSPAMISPPYVARPGELEELAYTTFEEIKGIKSRVEKKEIPRNIRRVLSEKTKQNLWKKAAEEFPDNRMMQEYYFFKLSQEYLSRDSAVKKKIRKEYRYKITGETLKIVRDKIDIKKLGSLIDRLLCEEELTNSLIELGFREKEIELITGHSHKVKVKTVKKRMKTRTLKPQKD